MPEHSDTEECWCRPTVQIEGYETFVYHNERRMEEVEATIPVFTFSEMFRLLELNKRYSRRRKR